MRLPFVSSREHERVIRNATAIAEHLKSKLINSGRREHIHLREIARMRAGRDGTRTIDWKPMAKVAPPDNGKPFLVAHLAYGHPYDLDGWVYFTCLWQDGKIVVPWGGQKFTQHGEWTYWAAIENPVEYDQTTRAVFTPYLAAKPTD
jgi:hypothetical protein